MYINDVILNCVSSFSPPVALKEGGESQKKRRRERNKPLDELDGGLTLSREAVEVCFVLAGFKKFRGEGLLCAPQILVTPTFVDHTPITC